jgi:hypothetical protein
MVAREALVYLAALAELQQTMAVVAVAVRLQPLAELRVRAVVGAAVRAVQLLEAVE